jgi:hypothetical protein
MHTFDRHSKQCFHQWGHQALFDTLMSFHLHPTSAVFNQIIARDVELYVPDDTAEQMLEACYVDRMYICGKDVKKAEEAVAKSTGHIIQYSDPLLLAWVHAAVTRFPGLIMACNTPLYIDRAYKFTDGSCQQLIRAVNAGLVPGEDSSPAEDRDILIRRATCVVELALIRFGASGDPWYIKEASELIGQHGLTMEKTLHHIADFYDSTEAGGKVLTRDEVLARTGNKYAALLG